MAERLHWRLRAKCRETFPELFEPRQHPKTLDKREIETVIAAFCDSCPVRQACLAYATEHHCVGIWGGRYFKAKDHHPTSNSGEHTCERCAVPYFGRDEPKPVTNTDSYLKHLFVGAVPGDEAA